MTAMLTAENILAGRRVYDTWCVNEDAEYHEAGEEGAQTDLLAPESDPATRPLTPDQIAALTSLRGVPEPLASAPGAAGTREGQPQRKSA